ncbi:MAG: histidinol-phosphate transaminase [Bacteriovoracaceae bacterium]|nr:histidinol-phosphate transaminase [Bacteriovoracaceae bacterium]
MNTNILMNNDKRPLVPEFIQKLTPYQAGKPIEELAREKNLSKITKLASNENPLGPSPFAIKKMTQVLWDVHRYPDINAYHLKEELCQLYKLKKENIILGSGSEGILSSIVRVFLQEGDEIVTSENTFLGFYVLAQAVGKKTIKIPLTKDYRFDVEAMADALNEKTRIIYIANPNNPTGTYITKKEFDYLMEKVPDHCIVILDEAYFEFAKSLASDFPDSMDYRYDNVITLRTFSKAYGLSGIRVGYGFAHENFILNLNKIRLPFEPNSLAQAGACGALFDQPHLQRTLENNSTLLKVLVNFLRNHGFHPIPSVTNFLSIPMGSAEACEWFCNAMMDEGVIIRNLKSFLMPTMARISIGTPAEMDHFYEVFAKIYIDFKNRFGNVLK